MPHVTVQTIDARTAPYVHITVAVAGFLAAVLWMDLTFDVQVMPYIAEGRVPEETLTLIRDYYRRVTVDSFPMGGLVGVVMCIGMIANAIRLFASTEPFVRRIASLGFLMAPSLWAMFIVFPGAQRLATEPSDVAAHSALAIRILYSHAACLVLVIALIAAQIRWGRGRAVESNERYTQQ